MKGDNNIRNLISGFALVLFWLDTLALSEGLDNAFYTATLVSKVK